MVRYEISPAAAPITRKNFASRNRRQQRKFRKRQLIDATLDCIDRLGISQTTVAKIAARADLSQSNVLFHFHSKEALLDQTLEFLNDEYKSNWQRAIDAAGNDPAACLCALIEASFAPQICTRKKISVWFAFWGESRSRPAYMRVCGANDLAFSQQMLALCEAVEQRYGARLSAATAALSIEGMIDGLWQNFLLGPPGFKRDEATGAVFELLVAIYPKLAKEIERLVITKSKNL